MTLAIPLAVTIWLAWDPPTTGADSYFLYIGLSSFDLPMTYPVAIYPSLDTTIQIDGLEFGVTYFFVATSLLGQEESDFSNEVTYTPVFPEPSPTPTQTPDPSPPSSPTPTPSPPPVPSPTPLPSGTPSPTVSPEPTPWQGWWKHHRHLWP